MKLGLTGGMGCGKSLVLSEFARLGVRTLESDAIVRELLVSDSELLNQIREAFGDGVFGESGRLDRKALGAVVFADEARLKQLEGLIHPKVRTAWTNALASDPNAWWVVEIPLLFELRLENTFDFTICVETSFALQITRLAKRGFSESEASARISRQMALSAKTLRADFVLSNYGSPSFLRSQVENLLTQLKQS